MAITLNAVPAALWPPLVIAAGLLLTVIGIAPVALWQRSRRRMRALARHNALLQQALEVTPCHFAVYDRERVLLACNSSYRALHATGFATLPAPIRYDDLMRLAVAATHPPERHESELAARIAQHESEAVQSFDRMYPNGSWKRIDKRRLPGGEVAGFAVDITSIKQREAKLTASEARLRALVDDAPVGIWHLDAAGRTIFANARLAALFPERTAPASLAESGLLLPAADGPFGFTPGRETQLSLRGRDGAETALLVAASPWVIDAEGQRGAVLTVLDISALQRARAQVEHMARHDPLTGLSNREGFQSAVGALLRGGGRGVLMLIDLDNFKQANDRHGHAAGDALLVATAARLRGAVRPGDTVCRLGGDEFAVVAPGLPAEATAPLADRLAQLLTEPVVHEGVELQVGASFGVAHAPEHGAGIEDLLRAADLALYEAKTAGRGRVVPFRPALRVAADSRLALRDSLLGALRAGELALHYQPQRELATGRLVGAEALLRWRSSRLGRDVPPPELLAAAREAKLIPALDEWVLETAVDRLAAWTGMANAPPRLAINVCASSLGDPGFADRVAGALLARGVAAERLEIELPEDLAVRDLDAIGATLGRLRACGVRLALDDFGAGLSSLTHVVRLPVDVLKLDRSIVAGLDGPTPPRAVLRATMALARGMGIEVLAEGVETEAQAFALRREGCLIAQGYLLGRPQAEDALLGALASAARPALLSAG